MLHGLGVLVLLFAGGPGVYPPDSCMPWTESYLILLPTFPPTSPLTLPSIHPPSAGHGPSRAALPSSCSAWCVPSV